MSGESLADWMDRMTDKRDEPKTAMTDIELLALAALVNTYVVETEAANAMRASIGAGPAYDCCAGQDIIQCLEEELVRRGVVRYKSN